MNDPSALEQALMASPWERERWLVYLDLCLEAGLQVGPLVELLLGDEPLTLERATDDEIVVSVAQPETRCTVQIRLGPPAPGSSRRTLSARWIRRQPPLDWVMTWPWVKERG